MELLKHEMTRRFSERVEQFFEARANGALAFRVTGPIDIRRIRHQQQHAALAVVGKRVEIEQLVVGGRGIHLEIAGVNDDAERSRHRQRDAADYRVSDANKFDFERAQLEAIARL